MYTYSTDLPICIYFTYACLLDNKVVGNLFFNNNQHGVFGIFFNICIFGGFDRGIFYIIIYNHYAYTQLCGSRHMLPLIRKYVSFHDIILYLLYTYIGTHHSYILYT